MSVDLKEVFSYELSSIPFSLVHKEVTLRKANTSVLMTGLDGRVTVNPQLPAQDSSVNTAVIIDGMLWSKSCAQVEQ